VTLIYYVFFSLFQDDVRVVPGSRPQFLCMSFPIQHSVIHIVDIT